MTIRAASCFSGIGGAECALPEAEWLWCADKRRTVDDDEADYLRSHGATVTLGNDGKLRTNAAADGPRYKQLGNAWAVPCARWILTRIVEKMP